MADELAAGRAPSGATRPCDLADLGRPLARLPRWLRAQAAELEAGRRCASSTSAAASSRTTRSSRSVASEYVGVDVVENPAAELLGSVEALPVDDASFDVVLCTQVLEHCDDPAQAVRELRRVTAPGGRVLASTHGVQVYHPSPVDYWRWTHDGLAAAVRAERATGRRCGSSRRPGTALGARDAARHVRRDRAPAHACSRAGPVWLLNRAGSALDARSASCASRCPGR